MWISCFYLSLLSLRSLITCPISTERFVWVVYFFSHICSCCICILLMISVAVNTYFTKLNFLTLHLLLRLFFNFNLFCHSELLRIKQRNMYWWFFQFYQKFTYLTNTNAKYTFKKVYLTYFEKVKFNLLSVSKKYCISSPFIISIL